MLTVYQVDVQNIIIGYGIEGFTSNTYMFLNKKKAFQYAYKLAIEHANNNGLPKTFSNDNNIIKDLIEIREKDGNFNVKEQKIQDETLKVSNCYIWQEDDSGYNLNSYSIYIYKKKLQLEKDSIYSISFNECK